MPYLLARWALRCSRHQNPTRIPKRIWAANRKASNEKERLTPPYPREGDPTADRLVSQALGAAIPQLPDFPRQDTQKMTTINQTATEALKRTKGPSDPDHRAAWLACRKPEPRCWRDGEIDLRAALDTALKAGWTIPALKAYAFCEWRYTRRDHVTDAAWRMAVKWAADSGYMAQSFLERFKTDPERYSVFVK